MKRRPHHDVEHENPIPHPGSPERSSKSTNNPRIHQNGSYNDPLVNQTPQDAYGRYGENKLNGDHGENALAGEHGDNALSGNDGYNTLESAENPDQKQDNDENGIARDSHDQDPESHVDQKDDVDNPTSLSGAEKKAKAANDNDDGQKQDPDGKNEKDDGNNPNDNDDQDDKKRQLVKRAMKHAAAKPAEQAGKTMFDLALAASAKKAIIRQLQADYHNSWWGMGLQGIQHGFAAAGHAIKHGVSVVGHATGKFFSWAGSKLSVISTHLAHFVSHIGSQMMANTLVSGMLTLGVGGTAIGALGYTGYLLLQPQKFAESTACTTQPMSVGQQAALTGNTTGISTSGMNNDNIKKTWDHLIQTDGFSGAAAAGACGNEAQESGGNPSIANPKSPVVGIFQWGSGGINGARFYNGGFCKPGDPSTWTLDNELKLTDWELHHSYSSWTSQYLNNSDPTTAATQWADTFEGLKNNPQNYPERQAYARQFFQQWGGSGVKANPSAFGAAASGDAIAGANDATNQALAAADCGNGPSSDSRPADGTGAIKENPAGGFQSYDFHDIPADMKQYVPDPTKVGLTWGSPNGWSLPGGQCVDFSVSYFHAIWKNAPKWVSGNGGDIAGNEAKAMGGSTSNTPHAGAVASVPGNSPASVAPGQWGHTFVVVHVLANGDIILLQENFTHSGDNVGKENTWEVGLCSKQLYQQYHWQFFTPQGSPNFG